MSILHRPLHSLDRYVSTEFIWLKLYCFVQIDKENIRPSKIIELEHDEIIDSIANRIKILLTTIMISNNANIFQIEYWNKGYMGHKSYMHLYPLFDFGKVSWNLQPIMMSDEKYTYQYAYFEYITSNCEQKHLFG